MPEHLVDDVVAALRPLGFDQIDTVTTATEDLMFSLPKELRQVGEPRPLGGRPSGANGQ